MVRMSDILKKALEKKREAENPSVQPTESPKPASLSRSQPATAHVPAETAKPPQKAEEKECAPKERTEERKETIKEEKTVASNIKISSLVAKKLSAEESAKLYDEILSFISKLFVDEIDPKSIDTKLILSCIEKIIDQLDLNNENLLSLAFIKDYTNSFYLYCHSLNVCIYCIEIGLGLGYDKANLMELGLSALLHDIGMTRYRDIAHQAKKLSSGEYKEIKIHSLIGSQILTNVKGISKEAILAAFQHHERIDGSGYPTGLAADAISEYAKIISIVDVYEAMTHLRVYHERHPSLETVQEVLNNKNKFEYKLVKILMERIGIFPVGSFIRLNNNEVAQVIKLTRGIPLRPVVKIILDPGGRQLKETKIVDLTTQPTVYIKGEEKINWDLML